MVARFLGLFEPGADIDRFGGEYPDQNRQVATADASAKVVLEVISWQVQFLDFPLVELQRHRLTSVGHTILQTGGFPGSDELDGKL
ncbi:hypothetical protein SDC9_193792 [bioreactor metagenome]|uniref:Uncharacterized protein n=1 Tax=bioreactor metagenome TaxID=1076179 RepID=A0A645I747_9ZZZZ